MQTILDAASRPTLLNRAIVSASSMPPPRTVHPHMYMYAMHPTSARPHTFNSTDTGDLDSDAFYDPEQPTAAPYQTNIPSRRSSYITLDTQKRNFFGMGEIMGVLANPAETVRSLTESKRLLEEARREIEENRERSQLRTKHTFSRLPGFCTRKAEIQAIERALEGEPSFTVLFGASSVGKTALLREVLSSDKYHVLHFDLRIAGFADLASLYWSLGTQMEQYFEEISKLDGYKEFEKESWSFKHDRLNVERRVSEAGDERSRRVKTSDVARLMELFQSSLLKYWEFQPFENDGDGENGKGNGGNHPRRQETNSSSSTRVNESDHKKKRWGFRRARGRESGEHRNNGDSEEHMEKGKEKEREKPVKKMPVIFFDEAHKLPALIQSTETMKCLLDSMLVLTKQDRLCHVIHATSDPFYQTWLRQLNVMQHCKIITIGDCTKAETRTFFQERVLPRVPERLRPGLNFEILYDAFGGKFAHWHDYITDYVNSNGTIDVKQSSHFLQAHALLNLHIIHSSQAPGATQTDETESAGAAKSSTIDSLHPNLGAAGFKIYSPITHPRGPSDAADEDRSTVMISGQYAADFSAMQLLKVMSRLSQPDTPFLPYFHLCRELGVRAVDGMVKGRVLDLRWTETVSKENVEDMRVRSMHGGGMGMRFGGGGESSATAVGSVPTNGNHEFPPPPIDEEEVMMPIEESEFPRNIYDDGEVVGPKLVPTTSIMRYAMREVVQEYEDDRSVSEYASLSDVDEY